MLNISTEVSRAVGLPEEKVSIVELSTLSPSLRLRVIKRGVKVLDKGVGRRS